ncbi:PREDICTED: clathrin coat assembly protein AP180 [Nelumbo nucifera]|uniref:Clathrin coat assembly protein AP180 n=1 Tax=Nelumbo nucifera TaxID=4432 RepID=A0A1U8B245_NELNU|nr:PREDICTED: clathrin coat assembly protein AP180 [Nelumbo nucifera]
MPSKFKKAIGAVKDHTSIGLAKVSKKNTSNLGIAVLKATTHEAIPVEERYVKEVILLASASKQDAAICAQTIAKRIGRTSNWIVALKSLMLVLRIFQEGDQQHFPREVLDTMKRGAKILNLSSFRDDSNSSPWDYTAFVRSFALYLDERLDCFLNGKLHGRPSNWDQKQGGIINYEPAVYDIQQSPSLLEKISCWQRLLDRAMATRPTGAAKNNRLVQICLYSVVLESFDLYRDISDGLAILLDGFFHLQYESCVNAFQTCVKASKQFEELSAFYYLCKGLNIGRTSEYPSVHKLSDELIDTLREFLKDQASFPTANNGKAEPPQNPQLLLRAFSTSMTSSEPCEGGGEASQQSDQPAETMSSEERYWGSEMEPQPSSSDPDADVGGTSPSVDMDQEQFERESDLMDMNERGTSSPPLFSSDLDLLFNDQPQQEEEQQPSVSGLELDVKEDSKEGWELVLTQSAKDISSKQTGGEVDHLSVIDNLYDQHNYPNYNNPFLQDMGEGGTKGEGEGEGDGDGEGDDEGEIHAQAINPPDHPVVAADGAFSIPTFQATPTFCAQNSDATTPPLQIENDPFAPSNPPGETSLDGSMNQHLLHEQQLWLQNQDKIIARNLV